MTGSVQAGLYGKLPAQGDFVRAGLPGDFVRAWDEWLDQVLGFSRAVLGPEWVPAWLEAPVWHFALPEAVCGAGAVLGLILPSMDRVGRYFPLTLAAVFAPGLAPDATAAADWLAACEAAGRAALEQDATALEVVARLPADPPPSGPRTTDGLWWTEGGPRVAPAALRLARLPDSETYLAMLAGETPAALAREADA